MTPTIGRDTSKDIDVSEGTMIATSEYYAQLVLNEMVKGEV